MRRINRLTFFISNMLGIAVVAVGILGLYAYDNTFKTDTSDVISTVLLILLFLAFVVYDGCLIKQRSNDVSGDHALLITILFIFSGLWFVLLFIPGEKESNRYGNTTHGIRLITS